MNQAALIARLQAAHALLQKGDVVAADRKVRALLAASPGDASVLHLLSLVQRAAGDLPAARKSLEQAIAKGGDTPEARNTLGNLLVDMGEMEEADRQFAEAIKADAAYQPAWINRGRLASRRGHHDEAIAMLERACALAPQSVLAQVSLGNALRAAGEVDRAVETLQRASDLAPAQGSTKVHLGVALRAAERPREAVEAFDAAERNSAASPQLLDNRAAAWLDLGEVEKARREYDALVARFPGYLQGHRARARLLWEYGLEGDPFESYRKTAAAFPREQSLWDDWINRLSAFRRYEEVIETARQAEAAAGPSSLRTLAAAVAQSELGDLAEADRSFDRCAETLGAEPAFLAAFTRHLLKKREPDRAALVAQGLVDRHPHGQFGWAYLGLAWRMMGDEREFWLHDYERHVAHTVLKPVDSEQDAEAFAADVAATLRRLHQARVHPADQSLRGGTQTPGALFDRRETGVRRLKEAVAAAVQRFIASLPDDPAHPFLGRKSSGIAFAGSWSVRLTQHGFHVNHVHDEGWISSAYYLALPDPLPDDRPDAAHLQLGAPPVELGLDLGPRRMIEPKPGTLALFPSSMWHGTVPFATLGERLTAAFDIVPAANG